ncbi:MAG: hypothetical protein PHZ00_04660 [Candidatus Peribacteraceae bacterium]|nr:hypothetical protein [Candidatus Peribacteraceae bacterium]
MHIPSRWQHRLVLGVLVTTLCMHSLALAATLLPSEQGPQDIADWQPEAGDVFIADTDENIGYLVHPDGIQTSFPIVTGQRSVVRYIGRVYNARTPARAWTVLSKDIKGDRTTFGKDGTFLRLTRNSTDEDTPYGIHSHRSAVKMLADDYRYRSMGCIIVSYDVLAIIESTFALSGNRLPVLTVNGMDKDIASLREELIESAPEYDSFAMDR